MGYDNIEDSYVCKLFRIDHDFADDATSLEKRE